jgi:hypothetical protein
MVLVYAYRYAAEKPLTAGLLPVTESLVIEFSRSLMKSGTLAECRDNVLLLPTHNHCLRIDRHDHTGENRVTSCRLVDKLQKIAE